MVIGISDLLKYKKQVDLKHNDKIIATAWVRILGDYDLQLSYRLARIASAKRRAELRDVNSLDYQDNIATISINNTREQCTELVKVSKMNIYIAEAYATVDREEIPKIEEVAEEPDGPSLEDQEKLDKVTSDLETVYQKKIQQYLEEHTAVLDSELDTKTDTEIFDMAKFEMSNILALNEFQSEVQSQKVFRATYSDEKCKIKAFADLEEYKNTVSEIKEQLITAYNELELSPDDIKN